MLYRGKKNAFFSTFWINFMECHSIQFTTISINVERGIVKILFKYRYFQDLLIDIDIDIDISLILLIDIDIDIDIFQNHHIDIDIDIDIFGIALSISISISIFSTSPYRYRYRYRYFSKVSIYRQSIFHIDILTRRRSKKTFFTGVHGEGVIKCVLQGQKMPFLSLFHGMSFYTVHYNIHKCRKRYC